MQLTVHKYKLGEEPNPIEEWSDRTPAERFLEVERLRRSWTSLFGNPDEPIAKVIFKHKMVSSIPKKAKL